MFFPFGIETVAVVVIKGVIIFNFNAVSFMIIFMPYIFTEMLF